MVRLGPLLGLLGSAKALTLVAQKSSVIRRLNVIRRSNDELQEEYSRQYGYPNSSKWRTVANDLGFVPFCHHPYRSPPCSKMDTVSTRCSNSVATYRRHVSGLRASNNLEFDGGRWWKLPWINNKTTMHEMAVTKQDEEEDNEMDEEEEEMECYDDEEDEDEDEDELEYEEGEIDRLSTWRREAHSRLKRKSRLFGHVTSVSWWSQLILTTVSGVILLFAEGVTERMTHSAMIRSGVPLAAFGIGTSLLSIFGTWTNAKKIKRWTKRKNSPDPYDAQRSIRRALHLGVYVNIVGMLCALVGAEQIISALVAQALTAQGFGNPFGSLMATSELGYQANTNTLFSHFCSLVAGLFLLKNTENLVKKDVMGT